MAIRNIVVEGDEVLLKKSRRVEKFDERLHKLLDDMAETLHYAQGVGLAAPQVGVLRRIFVIECEEGNLVEFINPEIMETSGEQYEVEGCLSVPGLYGYVTRPAYVKMKAQDRNGNWFEYEGTELTARAMCHENDHLNGHLFTEFAKEYYEPQEEDAEE